MSAVEYKQKIKDAIESFSSGELRDRALNLFEVLGYNTTRSSQFEDKTYSEFKDLYVNEKFNDDKAIVKDWNYVDILFQVSKDEVTDERGLFDTGKVNDTIIESYLFFTIELNGASYSRTQLSNISREVNKLFPMPVMILFKYNGQITLSIINRRINKKDGSKDVLEKVTQIKDINISNPHRAHVEILHDLSFSELQKDFKITNFVELHNAWQKTLDTKELNKRFYQELSNWYFWAMDYAKFPDDVEKDESIRNATNLIRLITRIIFIWFIKEKGLVPDKIFNRNEAAKLVKDFCKNNKSHYYYNAILQNLFFGTLNQNMKERKFAIETEDYVKRDHGVKNLYRYKDMFLIPEKQVLALFADVPFLNGGLFDCLDKDETETEKQSHQYIDGFSRNDKKRAILPDFLFFADEDEYDLNEIFGTKNKKYKVRGLIEILSSYKFTITENTPIEEEIALDPELLGKVFENLLASYNPETSTTARKQTGSFYTPREIVNYMVDESLIAYLDQKMKDAKCEDSEDKIRDLISYSEEEHKFDKKQTEVLICAIDSCKILDPACGSGAFPMGILHKLVHVLHKIDHDNKQWRELQEKKAIKETEAAYKIGDHEIRKQALLDIEDAFDNNSTDYGRKLYLIENCIYGVDIQPIAVQIAKLRFFISLIIDQKRDDKKENHGIRSLPNLETKFVAANTLIGLEKPVEVDKHGEEQGLLIANDIKSLESELKELRHKYFTAKTRKEKLACQKEDKKLREKISKSLISDGWDAASAKQLVAFDPYDQNASSPFFEPEWMFGVLEGFDVVISNPPYLKERDNKHIFNKIISDSNCRRYHMGKMDFWYFFLHKSIQYSSEHGTIAFITSRYWINSSGSKKLITHIREKGYLFHVVDIGKLEVFEEVAGHHMLHFYSVGVLQSECKIVQIENDISTISNNENNNTFYLNASELFLDNNEIRLYNNPISTDCKKRIDDYFEVSQGVVQNPDKVSAKMSAQFNLPKGAGVFVLSKQEFRDINLSLSEKKYAKHFFDESSISPYHLNEIEYFYLLYITKKNCDDIKQYPNIYKHLKRYKHIMDNRRETKNGSIEWFQLHWPRDLVFFTSPKVVIPSMFQQSHAAFIDKEYYFGMGTNIIISRSKINYLYNLCVVLNSKFANKWFYDNGKHRGAGVDIGVDRLRTFPLPDKFDSIDLKNFYCYMNILSLNINSNIFQYFDNISNSITNELYFPEEIKSANAEILKHLTDLPELKDDWGDDKKLKTIEKVYKELSDPAHPVSIAMLRQKDVKEVRIIEGL